MKTITRGFNRPLLWCVVTLLLTGLVALLPSHAFFPDGGDGNRGKDQELKIHWQYAENKECVTGISVVRDANFCPRCQNKKDCVCIPRNKKLVWRADGDVEFEIRFPGRPGDKLTPCTRQSDIKSRHSRAQCVIKRDAGEYYYSVKLKNDCKEYDPRIVIY